MSDTIPENPTTAGEISRRRRRVKAGRRRTTIQKLRDQIVSKRLTLTQILIVVCSIFFAYRLMIYYANVKPPEPPEYPSDTR